MPMGTLEFLDKYNARFRQINLTFKTRFCLDYTNTRGRRARRDADIDFVELTNFFEN